MATLCQGCDNLVISEWVAKRNLRNDHQEFSKLVMRNSVSSNGIVKKNMVLKDNRTVDSRAGQKVQHFLLA